MRFLVVSFADDYAGVGSRGKKETKPEALADLSDKASTVTACVDTDVKVRVYGDAAVATGLGTRSGTYKGVAFKDPEIPLDGHLHQEGRTVAMRCEPGDAHRGTQKD